MWDAIDFVVLISELKFPENCGIPTKLKITMLELVKNSNSETNVEMMSEILPVLLK